MVFPTLRGFISRRPKTLSSPGDPTSDPEPNHCQSDGPSNSLVRSAPRRGKPSQPSTFSTTCYDDDSSSPGSVCDPTPTLPFRKQEGTKSRHQSCISTPPLIIPHSWKTQRFTDGALHDSPVVERQITTQSSAPISGVPREVLIAIFRYAFPRLETFPDRSTSSSLLLRGVCKEWKRIVEGMPYFWLSLYPSLRVPRAAGGCPSTILNWYKGVTSEMSTKIRAFDHIVINLPEEREQICDDLFQYLLLKLAPRSAGLKLDIPPKLLRQSDVEGFFTSYLLETSTRRRLSDGIVMKRLRAVDWRMPLHSFGEQFPLDLGLPWTSFRRLPWHQLTQITLDLSISLKDCTFIFEKAYLVEILSLKLVSGEPLPSRSPQTGRKSLPHLRSLAMTTETSITPLFERFDMPQLCHLDLDLEGQQTVGDLPQLNVPWGQLTRLVLNCFLVTGVMENVIRRLGSVMKLELKLKGEVQDGHPWGANPAVLGSLKSFALLHASNTGGISLMSHLAQHIPPSIESLHAPFIPILLMRMETNTFDSLGIVELTQPIQPHDFLSFLTLAASLNKGSFIIRDNINTTSSPSSPLDESFFHYPLASPVSISFGETRSRLSHLELFLDFQDNPAKPLLDALVLPNLTSLKLKATRKASDCNSLYALLKRASCPLTHLDLNCSSIPDAGALRLLHLLSPTLEDLRIETGPLTSGLGNEFCQALAHEDSGLLLECLCPHLERLCLWPCRDPPSFYHMVFSRSKSAKRCGCGMRKLKHVAAGLPDSDSNISGVVRSLEELGTTSELKSLHS